MFKNLFGSAPPNSAPTSSFGANLPIGNKALSAEISNVGDKFSKTNEKYRNEINKYKRIADFNKKLSVSYIANIHAMIDVSKLLNDYALFFNLLKDEIMKTDGQIGSLKAEDIQYLESLTKAKIDEFSNSFTANAEKVKKLYIHYDQQSEVKTIEEAQVSMTNLITDANVTYKNLLNTTKGMPLPANSSPRPALAGGKKKRTTKTKTKK